MSMSTWRVPYYYIDYICKTDATPSFFKRFNIAPTRAQILSVLDDCRAGWCSVGGHGHIKHIRLYSIQSIVSKLREVYHL